MPEEKPDEATQKTDKGLEIPVPSRENFLRDLRKVAPPAKPTRDKPEQRGSARRGDASS